MCGGILCYDVLRLWMGLGGCDACCDYGGADDAHVGGFAGVGAFGKGRDAECASFDGSFGPGRRRSGGGGSDGRAIAFEILGFGWFGNSSCSASVLGMEVDMEEFSGLFEGVEDPRRSNAPRHDLHEMLMIALLSMLCGGEGCTDMERFGRA